MDAHKAASMAAIETRSLLTERDHKDKVLGRCERREDSGEGLNVKSDFAFPRGDARC